MSLSGSMRRLKQLEKKCGVGKKKDEPVEAVDMSKMSAYEKQQYLMAVDMKRVRDTVTELDELGDKATNTQKAELSNAIRKDLLNLKTKALEAKKCAMKENRREEYEALIGHMKKTEGLFRTKVLKSTATEEGSLSQGGPRGTRQLQNLDEPLIDTPMTSLRDDEEFQQFYMQTRQNDVKIDQALDRISAGVQRLSENAKMINNELKVQAQLLDDMEEKTDRASENLQQLNKKLKKTLAEVDKDKVCIYVFCLLLMLGIGGGIYYLLKKN